MSKWMRPYDLISTLRSASKQWSNKVPSSPWAATIKWKNTPRRPQRLQQALMHSFRRLLHQWNIEILANGALSNCDAITRHRYEILLSSLLESIAPLVSTERYNYRVFRLCSATVLCLWGERIIAVEPIKRYHKFSFWWSECGAQLLT